MIKDHEFIVSTDKPGTKLLDATGGFIELNSSWQSRQQSITARMVVQWYSHET